MSTSFYFYIMKSYKKNFFGKERYYIIYHIIRGIEVAVAIVVGTLAKTEVILGTYLT